MLNIFLVIKLPFLAGLLALLFKSKASRANISLAAFFISLAAAVILYFKPVADVSLDLIGGYSLSIGLTRLSWLVLVFINLFGLLTCFYSHSREHESRGYFSYLLWLVAFSSLAVFARDFITLIFAWGAVLVLLYALLSLGPGYSAKKALSIVGLADFALVLGICIYVAVTKNTMMPQGSAVLINTPLLWASFLLMLSGALAKAGCGPFHTWIPTASESASVEVMAILPASLDKLLGIYLLAKICLDFFILNHLAMALLLLFGASTITFAVMMALIQHDLRKLLSYHAISQVGYMVLGFGTGNPIGIAAGLFHMINNAIYKSGLFLTAGAVGERKNTFELERLGALASFMPVTFACGLIFSLSISGIPPLNGFASKWMIYQGALLGLFNASSKLLRFAFIVSLVSAMFGSALTLASFVKVIHAVFLGQDNSSDRKKVREVPFNMRIPLIILAALCIVLGLFWSPFVSKFIGPYLGGDLSYLGNWNSVFAAVFLAGGILLGLLLAAAGRIKKSFRTDGYFVGCEKTDEEFNFPATEFYRSVEEAPSVRLAYKALKSEPLDLYNLVKAALNVFSRAFYIFVDRLIYFLTNLAGYFVLGLSYLFRKMHTGVLDLYLAFCLAGLVVLLFVLMK
ncbi:MAG: hypothetical protein JW788_04850 [Candidatus Omnitrophica bacterium]|nr:hypothetical protein [Candidatus Omnitrophota bacterium]